MTDPPFETRQERRRFLLRLRRSVRLLEMRSALMDASWGLVAAALALVLPAPSSYTTGGEAALRLAGDDAELTQGLLFPVASGLKELLEISSAATTVRILAALAFGGAFAATLVCLRRLGFRRSATVPATLAAFTSVYAWRGSTSPIDYGLGLLGSALLLLNLCNPVQTTRRGYHWRAILAAGLAYLLHPETVLLVPAVALAVARHPEYRREGAVNLIAVLAVMATSIAVGLSGADEWSRVRHLAERALAGADDFGPRTLVAWIPALALGFGATLFGVYHLVLARRSEDDVRAPLWIVPWCLAALAPVVAGAPRCAPIAPYLVPAGALGLAEWLNRSGSRRGETMRGSALVAAQMAVLATGLLLG